MYSMVALMPTRDVSPTFERLFAEVQRRGWSVVVRTPEIAEVALDVFDFVVISTVVVRERRIAAWVARRRCALIGPEHRQLGPWWSSTPRIDPAKVDAADTLLDVATRACDRAVVEGFLRSFKSSTPVRIKPNLCEESRNERFSGRKLWRKNREGVIAGPRLAGKSSALRFIHDSMVDEVAAEPSLGLPVWLNASEDIAELRRHVHAPHELIRALLGPPPNGPIFEHVRTCLDNQNVCLFIDDCHADWSLVRELIAKVRPARVLLTTADAHRPDGYARYTIEKPGRSDVDEILAEHVPRHQVAFWSSLFTETNARAGSGSWALITTMARAIADTGPGKRATLHLDIQRHLARVCPVEHVLALRSLALELVLRHPVVCTPASISAATFERGDFERHLQRFAKDRVDAGEIGASLEFACIEVESGDAPRWMFSHPLVFFSLAAMELASIPSGTQQKLLGECSSRSALRATWFLPLYLCEASSEWARSCVAELLANSDDMALTGLRVCGRTLVLCGSVDAHLIYCFMMAWLAAHMYEEPVHRCNADVLRSIAMAGGPNFAFTGSMLLSAQESNELDFWYSAPILLLAGPSRDIETLHRLLTQQPPSAMSSAEKSAKAAAIDALLACPPDLIDAYLRSRLREIPDRVVGKLLDADHVELLPDILLEIFESSTELATRAKAGAKLLQSQPRLGWERVLTTDDDELLVATVARARGRMPDDAAGGAAVVKTVARRVLARSDRWTALLRLFSMRPLLDQVEGMIDVDAPTTITYPTQALIWIGERKLAWALIISHLESQRGIRAATCSAIAGLMGATGTSEDWRYHDDATFLRYWSPDVDGNLVFLQALEAWLRSGENVWPCVRIWAELASRGHPKAHESLVELFTALDRELGPAGHHVTESSDIQKVRWYVGRALMSAGSPAPLTMFIKWAEHIDDSTGSNACDAIKDLVEARHEKRLYEPLDSGLTVDEHVRELKQRIMQFRSDETRFRRLWWLPGRTDGVDVLQAPNLIFGMAREGGFDRLLALAKGPRRREISDFIAQTVATAPDESWIVVALRLLSDADVGRARELAQRHFHAATASLRAAVLRVLLDHLGCDCTSLAEHLVTDDDGNLGVAVLTALESSPPERDGRWLEFLLALADDAWARAEVRALAFRMASSRALDDERSEGVLAGIASKSPEVLENCRTWLGIILASEGVVNGNRVLAEHLTEILRAHRSEVMERMTSRTIVRLTKSLEAVAGVHESWKPLVVPILAGLPLQSIEVQRPEFIRKRLRGGG